MLEGILTVVIFFLLVFVLPVSVFLLFHLFRRGRNLDYAKRKTENWDEMLVNPDFKYVSRSFGGEAGLSLKLLYSKKEVLEKHSFSLGPEDGFREGEKYIVDGFYPLNEEMQEGGVERLSGYVTIAHDVAGNEFCVVPTEDDPPVFYYDFERDSIEICFERLSEFIGAAQRA